MRSCEERIAEIRRREDELRGKRARRITGGLSAASCVLCAALIFSVYNALPVWKPLISSTAPVYYGAAISESPIAALAAVAVIAFALGVCVTLLCLTLRRRKGRKDR